MVNAIQAPNNIAPRITMVNVACVTKKGPLLKPGILVICGMAGCRLIGYLDISSQSIEAKMSAPAESDDATKVNS